MTRQEAPQEDAQAQVPQDVEEVPAAESVTEASRVWIGEDEGQTALLIDGVVQSVVVGPGPLGPGYWPHMLPDTAPRRVLILGMGGGTIAHLLLGRFGPISITGVERDPRVIRLGLSAFGLDRQEVELLEGDAFAFASTASGPYDYIAVDLFAASAVPPRIFTRPFLKDVRRLLTRGGLAAFNYFKDRRTAQHAAALQAVFPRVSVVESNKNLIARCRAR